MLIRSGRSCAEKEGSTVRLVGERNRSSRVSGEKKNPGKKRNLGGFVLQTTNRRMDNIASFGGLEPYD